MSSRSAAFDLGGLDDDPALRETILAHLRENFGRMTSSTSTATPFQHVFDKRVADVKAPKSDINALVLDYLIMEGYPKAAAYFSKEANIQPQSEDRSIQARQEILHAIHSGDIETAITALNELDPELLDSNPELHFQLLRQQLVELIRQCNSGDVTPAVEFATKKLGPRAATNRDFLHDLEQTMVLIFFPHDKLQPELAALLSPDLRRSTAAKVNEALNLRQHERAQAAIRSLLRMRTWAENSARAKKVDLPVSIELGLNGENTDYHDGGDEPMITT